MVKVMPQCQDSFEGVLMLRRAASQVRAALSPVSHMFKRETLIV